MNIQDIMLRDIQDAEREQSERSEQDATSAGDESGFSWLNAAAWIVAALVAMVASFIAGMCYQVRYHSAEWCDRVEREATERARAMSNYELLDATRRECADAANR